MIESSEIDNSSEETTHTKWQEGDELTLIRVRFPGNAKSFPFLSGKQTFTYGQKVVAMSDRGMDVGYINSFPYNTSFTKDMLPLRSIVSVASDQDIDEQRSNIRKQKEAERAACDLVEKHKLDMNVTHVEITQFGKKMVFYFTAPSRVDFRNLVKDLVGQLKMRIELRQISVRDRAAALGSIGACGLATCCSSFLKGYGNVSIKMAKNQNLALIPSKINGVCGQIKCCIKYEDDVYADKRKLLPKEGTVIKVANGDTGKVLKLHLLIEQFDMMTTKGQIRRYARSQYTNKNTLNKSEFPERFDHIVNETSNVIGLSTKELQQAQQFEQERQEASSQQLVQTTSAEASSQANVEQETKLDDSADQSAKKTQDDQRSHQESERKPRRQEHGRKRNQRPRQNASGSTNQNSSTQQGESRSSETSPNKKKRRRRRPRNNKKQET